jgi:hypothetical protein
MAMASLSPSSVLASAIQVSPQVKTDLQTSVPQVAQDAQKTEKTAQTDTVTISPQALKMPVSNNAANGGDANTVAQQRVAQLASDKADAARNKANEQQAVQLANDKADATKSKAQEQRALQAESDKVDALKKETQKNAVKAYAAVSAAR